MTVILKDSVARENTRGPTQTAFPKLPFMPLLGYSVQIPISNRSEDASVGKSRSNKQERLPTVCDQLRDAIEASGWTHYRVGKQAKIKPEIVTRFVNGERDIRAETFAKIATALELELTPKEVKKHA